MAPEGKARKSRAPRRVSTRRLYIVRLDPAVLGVARFRRANPDHRPDKPCVYVGSTGIDPEARFLQHKAGIRSAGLVRRFGLALKQPTTSRLEPVCWNEAEAAERRLAEKLRARGYAVWQN